MAAVLLDPQSEEEWDFLRRCALGQYHDGWADTGAIQTLKLLATPRSLDILMEAQGVNSSRSNSITRAIQYVQSSPSPLTDANLNTLAERVAHAVGFGKWEGNRGLRFNQAADKALIDLTYSAAEDRYTYTATFHRLDGLWTLRGVRLTMRAFVMPLHEPRLTFPDPPIPRFAPEIPVTPSPRPGFPVFVWPPFLEPIVTLPPSPRDRF